MPRPVFSAVDPQIIQLDFVYADDLIDDIPACKTLPSA
jgi:hypothetical protein